MSVKSHIISAAVIASLTLGTFVPLASSAYADSWGGHQGGGYHEHDRGDRDWNVAPDRRYRGFEQYRNARPDYRAYHDDHADRRDARRDRKVARGVAIGLGVLMLGAILSQAGSHHDRYDY